MKKIAFLGDSITEGACVEKDEVYVSLAGKALGVEALNFGVGGSRIAKQIEHIAGQPESFDEYFMIRAKKIGKDADFVFVFGGTNDYGHGDADMGKFGDTTDFTFFGAAKHLTDYLVKKFGREKLCFILPLHRENDDRTDGCGVPNKYKHTGTLNDYICALVQVLDSAGIEYLDLRDKFPIEKLSSLTVDGLHPNPTGHKIIADAVVDYINKKGL